MSQHLMNLERICVFLLLIILVKACKQDERSTEILTINIDEIDDTAEPIKYSELFDDYDVIPLYSSGDSALGQIDELVISEDKIIVFDSHIYKGVLIYNKQGHVISGIMRKTHCILLILILSFQYHCKGVSCIENRK